MAAPPSLPPFDPRLLFNTSASNINNNNSSLNPSDLSSLSSLFDNISHPFSSSSSSVSSPSALPPPPPLASLSAIIYSPTTLSSFIPPLSYYESFIQSHHSWYLSLIETIRSLLLFLPGRFSSSEIKIEAVYCALNCLAFYHDTILQKPMKSLNNYKIREINNNNSNNNNELYEDSQLVKTIKNLLQLMNYTEILYEYFVTNLYTIIPSLSPSIPSPTPISSSDPSVSITSLSAINADLSFDRLRYRSKWFLLFLFEGIKCVFRLILLYKNNGKMLLPYNEQELIRMWLIEQYRKRKQQKEKEEKEKSIIENKDNNNNNNNSNSNNASTNSLLSQQELLLTNEISRQHSSLIDFYSLHGRYSSPHGRYIFPPQFPQELPPASINETLSEVLYFSRPVIYCFLRFALETNEKSKSWAPWIVSLGVDGLSRLFSPSSHQLSANQQAEQIRRLMMGLFYLLRSPFFDNVTVHPLNIIGNIFGKVPIVGFIFSNLVFILTTLQSRYFYTAAS